MKDLTIFLFVLTGLSAVFYLLSAASMIRMYLALRDEPWSSLSLFFLLLALGQLSMMISIIAPDRLSYALYSTSSAFAASGYLSLIRSRHTVMQPIFIPVSTDALAAGLAAYAVLITKGYVRMAFITLVISHALRAAGALLAETEALIAAESVRLVAAAILALGYARKIL